MVLLGQRRAIDSRRLLRTLVALGILVTLVSGTGVFAIFTDQATTGPNSVISKAQPKAADLQIATATYSSDPLGPAVLCGPFTDNLLSGLINVVDAVPSATALQDSIFCLKNAGTAPLTVHWTVTDLADIETDCTGDEGAVDTTCGQSPGLTVPGELSAALAIRMGAMNCGSAVVQGDILAPFQNIIDAGPGGIGFNGFATIDPGLSVCLFARVEYSADTATDLVQAAQTDQLTWRFRFDATAQ
jgi:predicted ribosomally synthesized peptide with SipW-like signal peptide